MLSLLALTEVFTSVRQNFWRKASNCLSCFGGGVLTMLCICRIWDTIGVKKYGICPSMPESVYHYANSVCKIRTFLPPLPRILEHEALSVPCVETLLFEFILQEMLLKQFPKIIELNFVPSHLHVADSKTAKVARVFAVAVAFTLSHSMHPGYGWPVCSLARLTHDFAIGVIAGTIQETTGSPTMAMAFLSGNNIPVSYYKDVAGQKVLDCLPAIPV